MAILNEEILNINLNKMKFYYKECLLDTDLLISNYNLNGIYNTKNTISINEYATNVIRNLKTINKNFLNNIIVLEKNISKYQKLKKETEKIFNNIGDYHG